MFSPMTIRLALAAFLTIALMHAALAAPSRIIVLRHGEKADDWRLCETGQQRAPWNRGSAGATAEPSPRVRFQRFTL